MKAEGNGISILSAQAAMGAQNQEFGVEKARWIPAHACILTEAKEISRWLMKQHLWGKR